VKARIRVSYPNRSHHKPLKAILIKCSYWLILLAVSYSSGSCWIDSIPSDTIGCRFTPGERVPGAHWIGAWVGSNAGVDDVEKRTFMTLTGFKLRPLGHTDRSL
jgi:hypothetical protein